MTALPEWIDPEALGDYLAMRKRIKKPMTDRRMRQFMARLYELHAARHDVNVALDAATDAEWLDVYPPKDKSIPGACTRSEAEEFAAKMAKAKSEMTAPPRQVYELANKLRKQA